MHSITTLAWSRQRLRLWPGRAREGNIYRAITETVHHTAGHLVSQQPPASHGHGQVDTAQNYQQDHHDGGCGGGDVKNLLIME